MRLRIVARGAVQGVGFRPFVFRLATELSLSGWVSNSSQGVFIEVEGGKGPLDSFLARLSAERPPRSFIQSLEASWLDPVGYNGFEIRPSETSGPTTALVLPDIATCPDCLRDISDPIIAAINIRSQTAPTAGRASRSSNRSPMTGRTPR